MGAVFYRAGRNVEHGRRRGVACDVQEGAFQEPPGSPRARCQFLSNCPEVIRTLINEAHGDDTYQRLTIYQHPVDKQYWRSTMYVGRILTFGDAQKMELFMNASREGTQQRQMYLAMIRLSISPSTPWIDVHGEPCASATALLNCCLDGATLRGSGPLPPSWVRF